LTLLAEALENDGARVAILKYSQRPVERSNTDAFWLMRPGRTVIAASPEETAIFYPRQLNLEEVGPKLAADVLLIEGGAEIPAMPRIVCLGEDQAKSDLPEAALTAGPVLACVGANMQGVKSALHFTELTPENAGQLAAQVLTNGLCLGG
jgi:molybdopterin-guanine dinucleotide biosynthesis protein